MKYDEFKRLITEETPINRKIRNARKVERDGVKFDSKLELFMFDLLRLFNIVFVFQKKFTLMEGFIYNGKKIQAITYTIDFYLPDYNCVIDTKGHRTQQGDLRIKLLKRRFADQSESTAVYLPKNKNECQTLINDLIKNKPLKP